MTIDKDELRRLAEAATPGPWGYDGSYVCTTRQEGETTYVQSWDRVADALLTKNVHYLAAANPSIILSLLDELEAAQRDAERLEWLDRQVEAYGFEDIHEGNRWYIDGPFRDIRVAIDAAMQEQKP